MIRAAKIRLTYESGGRTWFRQWSIDPETGQPRCVDDAIPASGLSPDQIDAMKTDLFAIRERIAGIEVLEGARRVLLAGEPSREIPVIAGDGAVSTITNPAWTFWSEASTIVSSATPEAVELADRRAAA